MKRYARRGRLSALVLLAASLLILSACGSGERGEAVGTTPAPSVTPAPFHPTVTSVPSPTDLPPVVPPTATPVVPPSPTPTIDPSVAAIRMEPNIGELDEEVRITAFGYEPGSEAALHWTRPGIPPSGNPALTVDVDSFGAFDVTLRIPTVWPGGVPVERDVLELRAIGVEGREAWAQFTYAPPFRAFVAPGGTYTNPTYGYAVDIPPGWTAQDSDPAHVNFGPEGEAKLSFIRVVFNSDVDAAIDGIMAEFEAGLSYGVEDGKIGALDARKVVTPDNRQTYWFVPHDGRVFVLHFFASDENAAEFTYSTFRFTS